LRFIVGQPHRRIPQARLPACGHGARSPPSADSTPHCVAISAPKPTRRVGRAVRDLVRAVLDRRFAICRTKRIHNFRIRAQFMELRRGQDARGPGARSKVAGDRKSRAERLVDQPSQHAPTTSLGQRGRGDPVGMNENFARQGLIIGERAPLSGRQEHGRETTWRGRDGETRRVPTVERPAPASTPPAP
jgi:hypothetical protein